MYRAAHGAMVCAAADNHHTKERTVSKLIADMSMSLDGRIATPDDDISRLARWFFEGDTEVAPGAPFRTSAATAELMREALQTVGAIIGGRRYFDLAGGWGGRHPMGVPVYILTHEPPADWPADSTIHFVTDGLASAVARAREAAGDKDIAIATPGTVRQCLDAGILDELQVNVVPVVLGEGLPFFDGIERAVELEGPEVVEGTGVTHLRYRVVRDGDRAEGASDGCAEAEAAVAAVAQRGRAGA
jgi:dihydrofolate reductase